MPFLAVGDIAHRALILPPHAALDLALSIASRPGGPSTRQLISRYRRQSASGSSASGRAITTPIMPKSLNLSFSRTCRVSVSASSSTSALGLGITPRRQVELVRLVDQLRNTRSALHQTAARPASCRARGDNRRVARLLRLTSRAAHWRCSCRPARYPRSNRGASKPGWRDRADNKLDRRAAQAPPPACRAHLRRSALLSSRNTGASGPISSVAAIASNCSLVRQLAWNTAISLSRSSMSACSRNG